MRIMRLRRRRTAVIVGAAAAVALAASAVFIGTAGATETATPGALQAEAYAAQSGARTQGTSDAGGGLNVGWLASGDWLRYDNVVVGTALTARVASDNSTGGSVELHLGSPTGRLLATFPVVKTGGWQRWTTVTATVADPPAGQQSVVAVMHSTRTSDFVNINWFTLGTPVSASPSTAPTSPAARPTTAAPTSPAARPTTASPTPTPTRTAAGLDPKKGVSTWQFTGVTDALASARVSWYYNWAPDNSAEPGPPGVEFVPMIWGKGNVNAATLAKVKTQGTQLLGFNEPDMSGQANMSVSDALAAWPQVQATGMRLGSPAVAWGGDQAGGWLDQFMSGAATKGYRVDFITLHWYGSDFSAAAVNQFLGYVDAVHKRYNKPIWVTEYALMNFSGTPKFPTTDQEVAFIKGSTAGLESRSYVERYAWFSLPAVGDSVAYGLYKDGHTATAAGDAYRAVG